MPEIKASILILEDDEQSKASLKAILEAADYVVYSASTGQDALGLVKQMFFDILLVDYKLPDINGLEFIKKALIISKDSIPIVITGTNSMDIAVESMRLGVHDFLIKPIDPDELIKNLSHILEEREEYRKGKKKFHEVLEILSDKEPNFVQKVIERGSGVAAGNKDIMNVASALLEKIKSKLPFKVI
jgi:two-component system, NtrC family, response regulator AtoC